MSKISKNLYTIYNNPFMFTPLILEFYKAYPGSDKDSLLSYLILPLVLHGYTKDTLKNATIRSSLRSFVRKKENYYALPSRIDEYKDLTNICIQNSIDTNNLIIRDNLSLEYIGDEIYSAPLLGDSMRAARNLVKVIKDVDVVSVYRILGVKRL